MINWQQAIDFYCERTNSTFWAEPINAISNISFLLAGFYGLFKYQKKKSSWLLSLSLLALCVGVGSFLFHTFANKWSHLADIIPIGIFMACFLAFTLKEILKLSLFKSILGTSLFLLLSVVIQKYQPREVLNGSLGYAHGLLILVIMTVHQYKNRTALKELFGFSTLVFCSSLFFRTIDHAVCLYFPLGTHFLWHTINGLLIGVLLAIVIKHD